MWELSRSRSALSGRARDALHQFGRQSFRWLAWRTRKAAAYGRAGIQADQCLGHPHGAAHTIQRRHRDRLTQFACEAGDGTAAKDDDLRLVLLDGEQAFAQQRVAELVLGSGDVVDRCRQRADGVANARTLARRPARPWSCAHSMYQVRRRGVRQMIE
jgi:hypothetical protein